MAMHAARSAGKKRRLSSDERWADPSKRTRVAVSSSSNSEGGSRADGAVSTSANQQTGGILGGAHHVVINGANMFNSEHFYGSNHPNEPLLWLEEHAMRGAEFDSSARDPPPRCHPGTRTAIIQRAQDWLDDLKREKKLLWLHGPAGVGKSAIVQTLAEIESKSQRLGATLFFSRSNYLNQPEKVFPTIAYQLAVRDPSYRAYIAELMVDPRSLDKAISEQFMKLIVEPFVNRNIRNGSAAWLIALDGLDECDGTQEEPSSWQARPRPGRHSDDYQRKFVELISRFVLQYPSVPLIWIIASRPEPHLNAVFSHQSVIPSFWEEDIPVDSDEACSDVEKYLRSEFDVIRGNYPNHVSDEIWPSNHKFLKIAKAASGLFAFASVIILFIGDPWVANPVDQLDFVLSVVDKLSRLDGQQHPLAALDALYTEILRRIPSNTWPVTKQLLATSILLCSGPSNLIYMCNILDIKQGAAVTALRHLHSVIKLPRTDKIGHLCLRFYHASFKDYLRDPTRSHEYTIDEGVMQNVANEWWWGMFRIIQQRTPVTLDALGSQSGSMPRARNISFSWPPNKATEKNIISAASWMWLQFMLGSFRGGYCEISSTDQRPKPRLSASELLPIIERIDFSEVSHEYEGGPRYFDLGSLGIFGWFTRLANHFPELERKGIVSYLILGSLDARSVRCSQVRYYHMVNMDSFLLKGDEDTVKELQRCIELAPSTRVAIWSNGGRCCAAFKIIDVQDFPESIYIVPDIRITRPEN